MHAGEVIIHEGNYQRYLAPHDPNAQGHHGLVPRDYSANPRGCYGSMKAVDFPTIPQSDWSKICADRVRGQGQLSDLLLYMKVPVLDQNGRGYCWAHSGTGANMAVRAISNEPVVGLSAYSVACKIKNFRDEGGWGAQGVDFMAANGVCDEAAWPQRGTSRSLDNAANWENAKRYKITAQLADMQSGQYDRNLTWQQYATLWLLGCPTVNDYNWWGHSVMGCDLVDGSAQWGLTRDQDTGKLLTLEEFEAVWAINDPVTAGFGCRIRNSWGESYGHLGFGVLTGTKAVPDGGVGVLVGRAAAMTAHLDSIVKQLTQAI